MGQVAITHRGRQMQGKDTSGTPLQCWMSTLLPDWLSITDVLMPGTHDSGTFAIESHGCAAVDVASRTQNWDLVSQLMHGVRFLDLRVQSSGSIYHGSVRCNLQLTDVLAECAAFLQRHPQEFLLVRIKHESPSKRTANKVASLMSQCMASFPFWCGHDLPALAELRGKIFLLQQWEGKQLGLQWGSPLMHIQDAFWQASGARKWQTLKTHLASSLARPGHAQSVIHVHFASATSVPYQTPRSIARVVNPRLADYLNAGMRPKGIIVMDFPTVELCSLIVQCNHQLVQIAAERHALKIKSRRPSLTVATSTFSHQESLSSALSSFEMPGSILM
ncbi:unnamed protein product [Polarella glacialis]|uniref:Phosphatidylinositol-specific phospholipase C X domain-containing protein n=1 Tax=Polarella glacialis TaxID=89957 RepID=A0A813HQS8_POLGL|nr:unnamed protein product [Polarella glacialis]CAE8671077.1 unnamed protein product [Polarella glacialis]